MRGNRNVDGREGKNMEGKLQNGEDSEEIQEMGRDVKGKQGNDKCI